MSVCRDCGKELEPHTSHCGTCVSWISGPLVQDDWEAANIIRTKTGEPLKVTVTSSTAFGLSWDGDHWYGYSTSAQYDKAGRLVERKSHETFDYGN
jgi:hypothetical protein